MARPLRIEFPGALYHVISRGNERRPIVRDDADRHKRIDWLRRAVQTYGWRLHAFVLMKNHDHLFVQTPQANLSAGMQYLNGSYTGYFNRRHRRAGHLFQGRFKGHLVEERGYYLEVSRYIHLNPVRARLVERPEQYAFSSYPGYGRAARELDWVTYRGVLGEFAAGAANARRAYGRFIRAGIAQRPKSPFAGALGGLILGSEAFAERIRKHLDDRPTHADLPELEQVRRRPSLETIIAVVSEQFGHDASDWVPGKRSDDASRAVAAYLARCSFGYPATDVAHALGYRSHGSVGNAIARIESGSEKLKRTVARLRRRLS